MECSNIVLPWYVLHTTLQTDAFNCTWLQVQRADDCFDVSFIARAKPDSLEECASALAKVSKVSLNTADSVSPGSEIELQYLSSSQAANFHSPTKMTAYTAEEVIDHFKRKTNLRHGNVFDDPSTLIAVLKSVEVSSQSIQLVCIRSSAKHWFYHMGMPTPCLHLLPLRMHTISQYSGNVWP